MAAAPAERGRRRRRTLAEDRSVHQRSYVLGTNQHDYEWTPSKDSAHTGERVTDGEPLPDYIQRHIEEWQQAENPRMARNHAFYRGRFLETHPEAPRLFRKFFEYAQHKWGSDDAEDYASYCRRERNRPESSAVWNELKTLMRRWDRDVNHNRNRMASINKIDFCSLIW